MKKLVLLMAVLLTVLTGCGGDSDQLGMTAENPIEIKVVRPWSTASTSIKNFYLPFIDVINEKSGGRLVLTDFGGSEVAPAFEQFRPLLDNQFQALYTHASYLQEFTTIGTAGDYVKGDWDVREECGLISSVVEAYKAEGVHWEGPMIGAGYKIYLNDEITTPSLKNLKIRSSGAYDPFIKALGGVPTRIPFPEIYTALEKGIIDGAAYASTGAHRGSWYNVVNYWVGEGLGESGGTGMFFNQQTWDIIPADMKELIHTEFERMSRENYKQGVIDSKNTDDNMIKEGTKKIDLGSAGNKKWQDTWYESGKAAYIDTDPQFGETVGKAMECVHAKTG